jgi:hypothetical protein
MCVVVALGSRIQTLFLDFCRLCGRFSARGDQKHHTDMLFFLMPKSLKKSQELPEWFWPRKPEKGRHADR